MQTTDYLGLSPNRHRQLGSKYFRNVICLHCRKCGNHLPCAHPKISTFKKFRAPRKSASRKHWQRFVDFLNRHYELYNEHGQPVPMPVKLP